MEGGVVVRGRLHGRHIDLDESVDQGELEKVARPMFQMQQIIPGPLEDFESNLIVEAKEREAVGDYAAAEELLTKVLALDLRCLEAHAHLGDRSIEDGGL